MKKSPVNFMKQNKYDDSEFFAQYAQMPRSKYGLKAAGEWHVFEKLLPKLKDKKVLDLGCGYGWHTKYVATHGAQAVIGIDISKKMIEKAQEINSDPKVTYLCGALEDMEFKAKEFDIIISSLVIHYIKDYEQLVAKVYDYLADNGIFLFSVEHPIFTASGKQDWNYDEAGNIVDFPIDNYSYEGVRDTKFLNLDVIKYHRTLATYLNTLIEKQFTINAIAEPTPPDDMLDIPGMEDEKRRPMMLIIKAQKEAKQKPVKKEKETK